MVQYCYEVSLLDIHYSVFTSPHSINEYWTANIELILNMKSEDLLLELWLVNGRIMITDYDTILFEEAWPGWCRSSGRSLQFSVILTFSTFQHSPYQYSLCTTAWHQSVHTSSWWENVETEISSPHGTFVKIVERVLWMRNQVEP